MLKDKLLMKGITMFQEFKTLCVSHGFYRRGKAFFRVLGDGVLQVLKYDTAPVPYNSIIKVGLFSLYGEIEPSWMTSAGCIPRYWIYTLDHPYEPTTEFNLTGPKMDAQIAVLKEKGFSWLDTILTQRDLIDALCKLDIARRNSILWIDMLKYAPLLKVGDFLAAEKVIQLHIDQHIDARKHNPEDVNRRTIDAHLADMRKFKRLLNIAKCRDPKIAKTYLDTNFEENLKHVSFCV